jgi:uncharacterized protein YneF (UPF0154 family)
MRLCSYWVQLILIVVFLICLTGAGLFIVADKMAQITMYEGPTLAQTLKTEVAQSISAWRAIFDYVIDKAHHIR